MQTQPNIDDSQNITPVDTLVHLGAGRCSELDDNLALLPRQILLVEADSQVAKELQNRIQGVKEAQVSCAAIAGNPGDATFYRYNFQDLNSLHPASGLMALFPGLKLIEKQQVKTVSPVTLLRPLQLQAEKENRLVVELPGEELAVLQILQQSQQLDLFSQINLYCGREPLYEGSETAKRIFEWLREAGFDLVVEDDSRDPDRPCWIFHRNILKLQNRDLQQQVERLVVKNGERVQHVADLESQVQELMQDREGQRKLSGALDAQINDLIKLGNDRQARIDLLTKERSEHENLVADLQAQAQQLTQDRDAQTKLARDRQAQLDKMTKEHDEQAKVIADLNSQLEQLRQAKIESEKLAADRKNKLEAAVKMRDEQMNLVADLQVQKQKVTQDREAQTKLASERQLQLDKVTKELFNQAKIGTDLNGELEQVNQAKEELENLAADRKNKLEAAVKTRDEQVKLVADLQAQIEKLTQDREGEIKLANDRQMQLDKVTKARDEQAKLFVEGQEKIVQFKIELRQANQTANLATKLQILRESDLQDLQQQYKASIETQNRQHELLTQLEDRLRIAAQYFHQLQDQQLLTAKESESLSPKRSKSKPRKLKNKK